MHRKIKATPQQTPGGPLWFTWTTFSQFSRYQCSFFHQALPDVRKMQSQSKQVGGCRAYHSLGKKLCSQLIEDTIHIVSLPCWHRLDVGNPSKCCPEPLNAPLCGTCMIAVTTLASASLSLTTNVTYRPATRLDCIPPMFRVLPLAQKPANLRNPNQVKILAQKNEPAPHRNQLNPLLLRQCVSPSSTPTLPTFGTTLPKPLLMLLRSQRRRTITN